MLLLILFLSLMRWNGERIECEAEQEMNSIFVVFESRPFYDKNAYLNIFGQIQPICLLLCFQENITKKYPMICVNNHSHFIRCSCSCFVSVEVHIVVLCWQ